MRSDDVSRAVVVIVLSAISKVAGAADARLRELLRAHLLVNRRANVRSHAEAFHRVRIEPILDLRPRNTEPVNVIWLAGVRIDIERDAVIRERRLIEHAGD